MAYNNVSPPLLPSNDPNGYWMAHRNTVKNYIYPGMVLPTKTPTVITSPITVPAEASHIIRLIFPDPGGRTGGTAANVDVAFPFVPYSGGVGTWYCGHNNPGVRYDMGNYWKDDGTSIPKGWLAAGKIVVLNELPGYGIRQPETVVMAGQPIVVNADGHHYESGFNDGGPTPNRLFTDPAIWALDYVGSLYNPSSYCIAGHSGGSDASALVAACDDRYSKVFLLQPGSSTGYGSLNDVEQWGANPAMQYSVQDNIAGLFATSGVVQGRTTYIGYDNQDEYDPGKIGFWTNWITSSSHWLSACVSNASLVLHQKYGIYDGMYHNIDVDECSYVLSQCSN
ncbi:hypothetical protein UFOVP276_123 [uncultured Caudovirales phage]|uniref:Uncharacterized protein n=1 Tax=uncultured Caudovirales phage TaxID=2100421 RepID=A0A6J5LQ80_9CAUD|nr:hypothetical protein UFOVP127_17 [uncultured Caudovirales phage]CAB4135167.1 hypothetical protein UFOVP276_123 [uncultured Caudovirales phage]